MVYFPALVRATFRARLSRFSASVRLPHEVEVHLPNSGRLAELLVEGAPCLVWPSGGGRKTWGTLVVVRWERQWVCVDSRMANRVFEDAWRRRALAPFASFTSLEREPRVEGGRLDFLLEGHAGRAWVEVKCVTLVGDPSRDLWDGIARFPDAPTARGTGHLERLQQLVARGDRAAVVFVVQREDAHGFTPHEAMDPRFARALREACRRGVMVLAYGCRVDERGIELRAQLPVSLGG